MRESIEELLRLYPGQYGSDKSVKHRPKTACKISGIRFEGSTQINESTLDSKFNFLFIAFIPKGSIGTDDHKKQCSRDDYFGCQAVMEEPVKAKPGETTI